MGFVSKAVPAASQKNALVERAYKQLYDYFVEEFAKSPTTATKVALLSDSENFGSPLLRQIWQDLYTVTIFEKKAIAHAALLDAWFQLPRLSREYQERLSKAEVVVEVTPIPVVPKKRGPKPKVELPNEEGK